MTQRKRRRAPFVITVGAALAVPVACGGESTSGDTSCPATSPSGACSYSGTCYYAGNPCGSTFSCQDGKWQLLPSSCNPPCAFGGCSDSGPDADAETCPPDPPSGACQSTLSCNYGGTCGDNYMCSGGKWVNVGNGCNPPPPECPPPSTPLPADGAPCDSGFGSQTCSFATACGLVATATCVGGSWSAEADPCADAGDAQTSDSSADAGAQADATADAADGD